MTQIKKSLRVVMMIEEEEEDSTRMSVRNNLSSFVKILSSYNSNVLLAALVFLLLVVLFVLLLHFYARYFWSHSDQEFSLSTRHRNRRRRRNRGRRIVTTTRIIPSLPLGGSINGEGSSAASVATANDDKGLDSSVISKIPLFVYEDGDEEEEAEEDECVICLGLWEVGDFGRKLRNCGHGFHVECIDMWLSSHSTCPLCRSPVLALSDQDHLKKPEHEQEQQEAEVRLQLSTSIEEEIITDGRRFSLSLDDLKTEVEDREGEVRIEINDEEGSSRSDRRSSSASSLMRMLSSRSSRSERNRVRDSSS